MCMSPAPYITSPSAIKYDADFSCALLRQMWINLLTSKYWDSLDGLYCIFARCTSVMWFTYTRPCSKSLRGSGDYHKQHPPIWYVPHLVWWLCHQGALPHAVLVFRIKRPMHSRKQTNTREREIGRRKLCMIEWNLPYCSRVSQRRRHCKELSAERGGRVFLHRHLPKSGDVIVDFWRPPQRSLGTSQRTSERTSRRSPR
jgi:hypothetical protein